jgi:hypothetical protein
MKKDNTLLAWNAAGHCTCKNVSITSMTMIVMCQERMKRKRTREFRFGGFALYIREFLRIRVDADEQPQ